MYNIDFGKSGLSVPTIAVGCMRIRDMSEKAAEEFINVCLENGANFLTMPTYTVAVTVSVFSEKHPLLCVTR